MLHTVAATGIISSPSCCEHFRQPEVMYMVLYGSLANESRPSEWDVAIGSRFQLLQVAVAFLAKAVLSGILHHWDAALQRLAKRQQSSFIFHI